MPSHPKRLPWRECAVLVAAVALEGFVMALSLHSYCAHAPSEVDAPVPGSPRANYCATVDAGHPWLLSGVSAALALALIVVTRRRSTAVVWGCILIAVAAALVAGRAGALDYVDSL